MAKLSLVQGTTSKLVEIFVLNSSVSTGAGLTGLAYNTSNLTGYYLREGASSTVAITLATMTLGTWGTGGFIVVDATNMPGTYQIGLPNAALASGANSVLVYLQGAANMAPVILEIELTAVNNQDAVRGGMTSLPNANAAASGGLPTFGTGSGQITAASGQVTVATNNDKTGYSLTQSFPSNFSSLAINGSGQVTYVPGEQQIKKNTALGNFAFLMVSTSDHVTPVTGLTVTATRSIDGGAFSACANAVTELGSGIYLINLATTDLNGTVITLKFTASTADTRFVTIVTQA